MFHVDRIRIPEIKALKDAQKINHTHLIPSSKEFVIAKLPCCFSSCLIDPTNVNNYKFKTERKIERRKIKQVTECDDKDSDDIKKLTVQELKDASRAHVLRVSGGRMNL